MTYLVMECHPAYAIVIDNEGRIMKAANLGYEEGQIVDRVIAGQKPKTFSLIRLASLAAAACLCLAVFGGGAYRAYYLPYGIVEVRINPDVKMSVSYMDRVVGLEGVNEDGKSLVEDVSCKGRTSEQMTNLLVERAVEMGYLSDGGDIYVNADSGSARWKEKRENGIGAGLEALLKGEMQVKVHIGESENENNSASPAAQAPPAAAATPAAAAIPSLSATPESAAIPSPAATPESAASSAQPAPWPPTTAHPPLSPGHYRDDDWAEPDDDSQNAPDDDDRDDPNDDDRGEPDDDNRDSPDDDDGADAAADDRGSSDHDVQDIHQDSDSGDDDESDD